MTQKPTDPAATSSDLEGQMRERRQVIESLRASGINPFANDVRPTHQIFELPAGKPEEVSSLPLESELPADAPRYSVSGRLLQINEMGKAKFLFLRGDPVGNLPGGIGQSSGLWLCAQNMGRVPVVLPQHQGPRVAQQVRGGDGAAHPAGVPACT